MLDPKPAALAHAEARISHRTAAPTQAGRAHDREWVVEFEPTQAPETDSLMGWVGSADVLQQVHMSFPDLVQAEAYCRSQNMPFTVSVPQTRRPARRSYADNFLSVDGGPPDVYPH
jgi:hypothetical protein